MSSELHKELLRLREGVSAAMQEIPPTLEVRAAFVFGTAWLGVIEMSIQNTHNLEERRSLINEFNSRRNIVEGAIRALKKESLRRRGSGTGQKQRAVLP